MKTLAPTVPATGFAASAPASATGLLAPLFETADSSDSLLGSRHSVALKNERHEIPKFMLLGARGGGKPIRLALFAGLDAGSLDTVAAVARLLLELELNPALARDYALFAYPLVNVLGFREQDPAPLRAFEARYAGEKKDADVEFFQGELRKWFFDGIITLRSDATAQGFHATVRSEVIAAEIVAPALRTVGRVVALHENPLRVRPADRHSRLADYAQGRLAPPADIRPFPFEIELFVPGSAGAEERVRGLFVAVHEILRNYRAFISHAQNL